MITQIEHIIKNKEISKIKLNLFFQIVKNVKLICDLIKNKLFYKTLK